MEKHIKIGYISDVDTQIVQGYCSNPEPPEKIMELPMPPFVAFWYLLAFLEAAMGINAGIINDLRNRTQTKKILSYEFLLNHFVISKYIVGIDIENFFLYLPEYVLKTASLREKTKDVSNKNSNDLTEIDLPVIDPADWVYDLHTQHAKDAILSLVAMAISSNSDIKEQLQNHINRNQSMALTLRDFLDCLEKETYSNGDARDKYAFCLGYLMRKKNIDPDTMFILTYNLWQWLLYATFKDSIVNEIARYLAERWLHIIEHQRFNLLQPILTVGLLKKSLKFSLGGYFKNSKISPPLQ